ncbi:CaiB/BaiF CoA transferase family protein [Zavarzinia aquatilis]|uniref:Carnitine dehydratase n=1 Tax=Zavarzinia aquatilis TaxID=2211142 RepID=A0A317EAK6_9PROT|nr:CoA transferase [Zavarzinia aquatilis]PWR24147.1 carnitine dehydratase [Zavarzinia aquatilis]
MQPLSGIRVVDLTSVVAGPLATKLMAEQGAEVWKIEPVEGDRSRMVGFAPVAGFSSTHLVVNAGKQSVALDLTREEGRALLRPLIARADILIHNFRPGVMDRMGLPVETLWSIKPDLVIVRVAGFGQQGPMSGDRAYDPVVQAESGMVSWTGEGPVLAPQWICDKVSGLYAAQAAMAALVARERTGKGSVVDISMLEAAVAFGWMDIHGAEVVVDRSEPVADVAMVYRPWATADGWIVVVMLSQEEFAGWSRAIGMPDLLSDPRFETMRLRFLNWAELRDRCSAAVAALTTDEALSRLGREGVPCGRANRSTTLPDHAQLRHDDFLPVTVHPEAGRIRRARPVARFDGMRGQEDLFAPAIGEHTRAVLAAAGVPPQEIEASLASGAALAKGEIGK